MFLRYKKKIFVYNPYLTYNKQEAMELKIKLETKFYDAI